MEAGNLVGERCGRNGCAGIIAEKRSDVGCSCHIAPPCSFCTTPREYCPECDWDAEAESRTYEEAHTYHLGVGGAFAETRKRVLDNTKIDWISTTHSGCTMIREGVYPPGATRKDVEKLVRGTFGGRFRHFGDGRFEYVAYTD